MLAIFTFDSESCRHSSANAARPAAGKLRIAKAIAIETRRMETSLRLIEISMKRSLRRHGVRRYRPHAVFWVLHL
ncbi:hypothetical protein DPM33_31770 [Mesorhizobium hawassense]|uniref:Uncharacterized protein n=1 Tax=Mesorhizobium hawassense TaxID=1209954 RepID=A0A330H6X4_9HYPH|nr:hypothetical protein DPM33_31770 [Mesorhizobium hawassense]